MARPLWKGAISFGLVTIPVSLHSATRQSELRFRQLDRRDRSCLASIYEADADGGWAAFDQFYTILASRTRTQNPRVGCLVSCPSSPYHIPGAAYRARRADFIGNFNAGNLRIDGGEHSSRTLASVPRFRPTACCPSTGLALATPRRADARSARTDHAKAATKFNVSVSSRLARGLSTDNGSRYGHAWRQLQFSSRPALASYGDQQFMW